jgi:Secretion system C-terminal sorting domain
MKKFALTISLIFILSSLRFAQDIPNGGFENWTNSEPDSWITTNNSVLNAFPVTQSSSSHSGSSAARLEVVNSGFGIPVFPVIYGENILVNKRYGSLTGYYQFYPSDQTAGMAVIVSMYSGDNIVGGGESGAFSAASSYVQFSIPIDYTGSEIPDSAYIHISAGSVDVGTYALIDDLSWEETVGIDELSNDIPSEFKINQNYPNPFNPLTTIEYSIPKTSYVELKVFDVLGNEVATLVNKELSAGFYKAVFSDGNLASGLYIARIIAGNYSQSIKMSLVK